MPPLSAAAHLLSLFSCLFLALPRAPAPCFLPGAHAPLVVNGDGRLRDRGRFSRVRGANAQLDGGTTYSLHPERFLQPPESLAGLEGVKVEPLEDGFEDGGIIQHRDLGLDV